ncbi:MAG: ABC transporter substrate-binding protein [Wenzhouxiangella sp.]|nr:ABC transporter substrate-binding protein [Wenzhouxiangella sp.]MCH8477015.1 helical backbone metal receptor [Wenzhouxiangella sp.]TVR96731.1 MAG: hypothetical protein EA418_04715 [Wenzhouxiangellaceae bacterium]
MRAWTHTQIDQILAFFGSDEEHAVIDVDLAAVTAPKREPGAALITTLGLAASLLLVAGASVAGQARIVTLAPHLTELAYSAGLGDKLVGVVEYSDYPPEAAALPSIGNAFRFDMETIMVLGATRALAWDGGTPQAVGLQLEALGVEVTWIRTRSLDDIVAALLELADLASDSARGQAAARSLEKALTERREAGMEPRGSAFYQVSARPLYTLGSRHVINEVLALCGLENLFADLDIEAAVVDLEAVLARQPDWIIVSEESSAGSMSPTWKAHGFSPRDLLVVDPTVLIRPTPRIIQGIELLCAMTAPDT